MQENLERFFGKTKRAEVNLGREQQNIMLFQNLCSNSTEMENSSSETKLNLEGSHYLKFINRQTDNVGMSTTRDNLSSREQLTSNRKSFDDEDKKVGTNTLRSLLSVLVHLRKKSSYCFISGLPRPIFGLY